MIITIITNCLHIAQNHDDGHQSGWNFEKLIHLAVSNHIAVIVKTDCIIKTEEFTFNFHDPFVMSNLKYYLNSNLNQNLGTSHRLLTAERRRDGGFGDFHNFHST